MQLVVQRCAGLDIGKDEVVACVRVPEGQRGRRQEVRTYASFSARLEAMAEWLEAEGVTEVVMEATGHGLLRGSFVPPPAIRELRDLTRYRKRLIQTHASADTECSSISTVRTMSRRVASARA